MLVGKIKNHHTSGEFLKGEEKGMFLYGGSTIVVLLKENAVEISPRYFENTNNYIETDVKMGEALKQ
jgi:phosphatidylserine decarboxylase